MKRARGFAVIDLLLMVLIAVVGIGGVGGWVWNIVKIVHANFVDGMLIARCIGVIVAPLGAVLGWF